MTTSENLLDQGIIPHAAKLVVGVSGGIDSMALLHLLCRIKHALALEIIVAHYDHALRLGSSNDMLFVSKTAAVLGLKFVTERNRKKRPSKTSWEDFARQQRFDFLTRITKRLKADAVILAHTQDDLAETVLMRILRGTGLSGLRSILPSREINGILFLRPLLNTKRSAIEEFMAHIKADHVEDPSNDKDIFLRNKVRRNLIPYIIKNFAPTIKEKLAQLACNAAIDYDVLDDELKKVWPEITIETKGRVQIHFHRWQQLSRPIRRMVLREAASHILGGCTGISLRHITLIETMAQQKKWNKNIDGNGGLKIVITNKFITLS